MRLGRDYYVRVAGNDYSVDPNAIGQIVEVTTTLAQVTVSRAGRLLAAHERCWAARQTLTDPRTSSPPQRCASSSKPVRHRRRVISWCAT